MLSLYPDGQVAFSSTYSSQGGLAQKNTLLLVYFTPKGTIFSLCFDTKDAKLAIQTINLSVKRLLR